MTEHATDECNQGHPLCSATVRLVSNPNGTTYVRCLECERAATRAYQLRRRQKLGLPPPRPYRRKTSDPPQPKPARVRPLKEKCDHGHPLSGNNVKLIKNSDGTTKRRCLTCERTSTREYQRRQRAKTPPVPVRTFAQKITDYTKDHGECHIWIGKLDKGHPSLFHDGKYTRVRKALYEYRYGAIKHTGDTAVTCGHELCVNEAHIVGMQRELRAQAQLEAQAARAQAQREAQAARVRLGSRVMQHWNEILRYAQQRAGDLDAEDIAGAAVTATYDKLQAGKEITDTLAFMRTTVRNSIIDRIRQIKQAPMLQLNDTHDAIASPLDTTEPLSIWERAERIQYEQGQYRRTLARIAYKHKRPARVFRLKLEGLSAEEIGDKLGIAVHTVERHMTTALRIAFPTKHTERPRHEPIATVLR